MITLSKSGNSVTFTFDENSGYLQNGTIDVPINTLSLILDESDMATFRKSASNDIFISARYEEFGMSKAELEAWYKANMVGSSGVSPEEVQEMIDEAVSGKADSVSAVSSAEYVSSSTTINFKNADGTVISSIDASDFVIDGMIDNVSIETISGASYLVIDFNTASGKEDIQIPLTDIFDPSNYYTKAEVDASLSGKADTTAVTQSISESVSGKVDTSTYTAYTAATDTVLSGKQDTLSAGTNITISGNVISAEGGGGTVSSAITSGDTNAVAGGAVFDAVNYVSTSEDWDGVAWAVDDETKVSEEINNSIIKVNYDTMSLELESSASVDVTFEGDEQVYTITFYNTDDPEPHWDLDAINDYLDNYDWDGGIELTITANTPFNVVSASTDAQLLMDVAKYSETTTVTSIKDKVNISVTNASINGHNNIIELVTTLNNGNQANTSIGLYDLKTTNSGQLATDIKVPFGSGVWTAVTFVDSATKETEEINASQVKITLTGTPSQDNSIWIQDGEDNWRTIMYDDDAWRNDTSFLSEITVSGNDLYLTASEGSTIKKLAADENPELIDSVEKFIEQTQDLIPYVQETKSDLGGLKLQQVTQAQYDALVSGGTVDNSTIYYIVN